MTAVASPPSVQSGPRLGWYSSSNGGQGGLSSMDADEVSQVFMPRKSIQRSNSSSSLSSKSSTSTVAASPQNSNAGQYSNNTESSTWSSKKKPPRNIWPSSKSEPVSGVTNTRSQVVPAFSAPAASNMSGIHQPSSIVPSQTMHQTPQQNGARAGSAPSGDPPAILTLLPLNGTFEKKQINVPFFPDLLRIGRQTNAKTVPTSMNGYFDSKVLSRQHAEIWAEKSGKIWIRDVKSSNGTFVNGHRLSPENRESDPHEVRENDTLELGIDIVSEDQKTIVHHKVSAKVEHAGVYTSIPNILDLTLGDLDPASGGGLLPSPLSQPLSHFRGRSGSNMSNRSAQSAASNQHSAMQQQRQMNYWNSPMSIEQVVKRLTSEMKQAKQQSQDLRQTDTFLATIMKPGHPEKEKVKHSENNHPRQMNGRPKMPRVDSFSRFSDPPAPPPQQPLPEKPDALPQNGPNSLSPLKRADTEKPKIGTGNSPVSREPSQILSLIEALSSAKRELESQGTRVKELEVLLLNERTARESAEDKARMMEAHTQIDGQESETTATVEPPLGNVRQDAAEEPIFEKALHPEESTMTADRVITEEAETPENAQTKQLQSRLEVMMKEMEEMRHQLATFKERAENAENERAETRKSLAEMIETLRRERIEADEAAGAKSEAHVQELVEPGGTAPGTKESMMPSETEKLEASCHTMRSSRAKEAADTSAALTAQQQKENALEQSGPYASMLGVVLLGVGLMAYLNGWQRMDKVVTTLICHGHST